MHEDEKFQIAFDTLKDIRKRLSEELTPTDNDGLQWAYHLLTKFYAVYNAANFEHCPPKDRT